jgi:hypothetical protein
MSFFGNKEEAKKWAQEADHQIDDLMTTSPVRDGGTEAGGAPMEGRSEFTTDRTRHGWKGNQGLNRREYPAEGVSKKATSE